MAPVSTHWMAGNAGYAPLASSQLHSAMDAHSVWIKCQVMAVNACLVLLAGGPTLHFLVRSALSARLLEARCTDRMGYHASNARLGTSLVIGLDWTILDVLRAPSEVLGSSVHGEWSALRVPLDQSQTSADKAVNSVEESPATATVLGRAQTCIALLVRFA